MLSAWTAGVARAANVQDQLNHLNQSMRLCITTASRPGFPYYDRPEASTACQQTKTLLHRFGQKANRNRNLACSSRIADLDFDIWMIQFLGGERMQAEANQALHHLARNCFNMDSR